MDISIKKNDTQPPTPYAHSLSMVIKSFKGRRNVEVHLFRGTWDSSDENSLDWPALIDGDSLDDSSKNVVMESFTSEERDLIVNYLKEQYSTRLTAITSTPLTFPVPSGLAPLSQLGESKTIGIIDFAKIPNYILKLPLKGLYDLSQHPPIAED